MFGNTDERSGNGDGWTDKRGSRNSYLDIAIQLRFIFISVTAHENTISISPFLKTLKLVPHKVDVAPIYLLINYSHLSGSKYV